jgi:hypothetical protein
MRFVGGVELMYGSVSKSENILLNMTGINCRKCLNENLCLYTSLRNIVASGNSPYHRAQVDKSSGASSLPK